MPEKVRSSAGRSWPISVTGRSAPVRLHEPDDLALRPIAVVLAPGWCRLHERAVTTLGRYHRGDPRVVLHHGFAERPGRYERVVCRGQDERGDPDAIDKAHRAGAVVVVAG